MPQQERAHVTRDSIVVAAAVEFDRAGYAATSLNAILRRSGVTKGAFYFHFSSKEAVADDISRRQRTAWPAMYQRWQSRDLDPLCTLIGLLDESVRSMAADPVLRAGVRLACDAEGYDPGSPVPYPEWERVIGAHLSAAAEAGLLRTGVDPELAARLITNAYVGVRIVSSATTRCVDLVARSREIWDLLLPLIADPDWLRGFDGPEGLAELS